MSEPTEQFHTPTETSEQSQSNFWEQDKKYYDVIYLPKLIMELTGVEVERTMQLIDTCASDFLQIKEKYNLPLREMRFSDPDKYIETLTAIAAQSNTKILSPKEDPDFLELQKAHPSAGAALHKEKNVITIPDEADYLDDFTQEPLDPIEAKKIRAGDLEHEIIHLQQDIQNPQMSIEQREYEAYVGANFGPDHTRNNNPAAIYGLFQLMKKSIDTWYKSNDLESPWTNTRDKND